MIILTFRSKAFLRRLLVTNVKSMSQPFPGAKDKLNNILLGAAKVRLL